MFASYIKNIYDTMIITGLVTMLKNTHIYSYQNSADVVLDGENYCLVLKYGV